MKGIIIAAGRGKRLKHMTDDRPKCLLSVQDCTMLENTIHHFKKAGAQEIAIVIGYKGEKIREALSDESITYFQNEDYLDNNILHSLFKARDFLTDDTLISYSDVWYHEQPFTKLMQSTAPFSICVDTDWIKAYEGRSDHPLSEAENVLYDAKGLATLCGKNLYAQHPTNCGEFIGLLRTNAQMTNVLKEVFDEVDQKLDYQAPFHFAQQWQKAYLTDFFNELIQRDYPVHCSFVQGGWTEIDTIQDYEQLSIKERQHVLI